MGRNCCACGAAATREATLAGIHFVRFPTRKDLRKKWIEAVGDGFKPRPNSVLCSRHFEPQCFEQRKGGTRLCPGSVPIKLTGPSTSNETSTSHKNDVVVNNNIEGKQTCKVASESKKETAGQIMGADNQNKSLHDTSLEGLEEYDSVDDESSEDLPPPVLRPFNEIENSDFEEGVEDPPDLECSLPPVQESDPDFMDMPEVDASQIEIIGSVGDFFDTDSLPLFIQPSESQREDDEPNKTYNKPVKAERDEVDGQTILSFASFEDLENFSHKETTGSPRRPKKTDDYRLIKGWRNKLQHAGAEEEAEHPKDSIPRSSSPPMEFRLKRGETISAAHAKYAARAVPAVYTTDASPMDYLPETSSEMSLTPQVEMEEQTGSAAVASRRGHKSKADRRSNVSESASPPPKRKLTSDKKEMLLTELEYEESEEMLAPEEPYEEKYDVPGVMGSSLAQLLLSSGCGKLYCRLGCICDSLSVHKSDMEHCNRAECMLTCVCGYRKDKSCRRNNTFYKLLKGNESYYSKIDWSSQRQRRERKIPERFRDSVFHHDTDVIVSRVINEEKSRMGVRKARPSLQSPRLLLNSPRTPLSSPHPALVSPRPALISPRTAPSSSRSSLESPRPTMLSNSPRGSITSPRSSFSSPRSLSPRIASKVVSPQPVSRPTLPPAAVKPKIPAGNADKKSPKAATKPASPILVPRRKREPCRVKVNADEMKFLRWGSYVRMGKMVVPPSMKIYCMEHEKFDCPCIETDRRLIRISNHFTPPRVSFNQRPRSDTAKSVDSTVGTSAPPESQCSQEASSVDRASVASDDLKTNNPPTSPNADEADESNPTVQGIAPLKDSPAAAVCTLRSNGDVPNEVTKPAGPATVVDSKRMTASSVNKMKRLVQGERFGQLILQEKMRIFDEDMDLTIRSGETVELVAWIRFHRMYHAGKMHIRVLIRRTGPMILVMRPNEIVAEDITTDIQDLKDDPTAPDIVRELLDPYISPGETTRYALLLCDGVKWELVSCLSPSTSSADPASPPHGTEPGPVKEQPTVQQSKLPNAMMRPGPKSKTRNIVNPQVLNSKQNVPIRVSSQEDEYVDVCGEGNTSDDCRVEKMVTKQYLPQPPKTTTSAQEVVQAQIDRFISSNKRNSLARVLTTMAPSSRAGSGPIITSVTSGSPGIRQAGLPVKQGFKEIVRIKEEPRTDSPAPSSIVSALQPVTQTVTVSASPRKLTNWIESLKPSTGQATSSTTTTTVLSQEQRMQLLSKLSQVSQPFASGSNTVVTSAARIVKIPSALLTDGKNAEVKVVRLSTALTNPPTAKPNGAVAVPTTSGVKTFARNPQSVTRPTPALIPLKTNLASIALASFAASAAAAKASAESVESLVFTTSTVTTTTFSTLVTSTAGSNVPAARVITSGSASSIPSVSIASVSTPQPSTSLATTVASTASMSAASTTSAPIGTQRFYAANTSTLLKKVRGPVPSAIPLVRAQTSVLGAEQLTPLASNSKPLKMFIANQRAALGRQGAASSSSNTPSGSPVPTPSSVSTPASTPSLSNVHDPTLLPLTPMPSSDISLSLPGAADDVTVLSDDCPSPKTPDPTLLPDLNAVDRNIFFPTPSSVTVSCVQLPTGSWSRRLKIIYNVDSDQQKNQSQKTPTTALLPLQNEDDQWCVVAIDHVPASGLEIPGSNVSIPQAILEQAAQTACARNFRVSFPLHVVGGHHCPIPQKGFGVYGVPKLSSHVFLGPFTRDYLNQFNCSAIPYMNHIQIDSSQVTISSLSSNRGDQQLHDGRVLKTEKDCEPTGRSAGQNDSDEEEDEDESSLDSSEECSIVPEDRKPVTDIIYGCQAGIKGQEWYRSGSNILTARNSSAGIDQSSDELEIIKDIHLATREGRLPKMRHLSIDQLPAKPERVFVVRVPGLPPTTMSVLEDNMIVVKHPLNSEESVRFSSVDEGKDWLKSLSIVARSLQMGDGNIPRPSSTSRDSSSAASAIVARSAQMGDGNIPRSSSTSRDSSSSVSAPPVERYKPGPKSRKGITSATNTVVNPVVNPVVKSDFRESPVDSEDSNNSNNSTMSGSPTNGRTQRTGQQHILHNRRERERRGVMAHRMRELGGILADGKEQMPMTKLSVLKHATMAIKNLELESKDMKNTYLKLKSERRALITKRKQIYSSLPSEVKNVFRDLTVNTPMPERHKNIVLKNEKCDDDVVDDLNLDESESATLIDVEIESDLFGDFNDFLEVDVVSIDDEEPDGKSLNLEWPCSPTRKN